MCAENEYNKPPQYTVFIYCFQFIVIRNRSKESRPTDIRGVALFFSELKNRLVLVPLANLGKLHF